jgi:hypothetical protein
MEVSVLWKLMKVELCPSYHIKEAFSEPKKRSPASGSKEAITDARRNTKQCWDP